MHTYHTSIVADVKKKLPASSFKVFSNIYHF